MVASLGYSIPKINFMLNYYYYFLVLVVHLLLAQYNGTESDFIHQPNMQYKPDTWVLEN
jgi:hypothetical protein